MSRDDALLLDMLLSARKAIRFTQGVDWAKFENDDLIQNAVMHVIQVVGEAATKVSDAFKTPTPRSPGRQSQACATDSYMIIRELTCRPSGAWCRTICRH